MAKRNGKAIQLILRGMLFVRFELLELLKFLATSSARKRIFGAKSSASKPVSNI